MISAWLVRRRGMHFQLRKRLPRLPQTLASADNSIVLMRSDAIMARGKGRRCLLDPCRVEERSGPSHNATSGLTSPSSVKQEKVKGAALWGLWAKRC